MKRRNRHFLLGRRLDMLSPKEIFWLENRKKPIYTPPKLRAEITLIEVCWTTMMDIGLVILQVRSWKTLKYLIIVQIFLLISTMNGQIKMSHSIHFLAFKLIPKALNSTTLKVIPLTFLAFNLIPKSLEFINIESHSIYIFSIQFDTKSLEVSNIELSFFASHRLRSFPF